MRKLKDFALLTLAPLSLSSRDVVSRRLQAAAVASNCLNSKAIEAVDVAAIPPDKY
jgi:hypothetical protein